MGRAGLRQLRGEVSPEGGYITLGDADPSTGSTNDIYGWGRETPSGPPASALKTAQVTVVDQSSDAYGGPAVQSEGVNGTNNYGSVAASREWIRQTAGV